MPATPSLEQKRGGKMEKTVDDHCIYFLQQQTVHYRLYSNLTTVLNPTMAKWLKTRSHKHHPVDAM